MLRLTVASILALAAAVAVDRISARRGLDPPGFRDPARRLMASLVLFFIFLGVFLPAVSFDLPRDLDLASMGYLELFFFQILLVGSLVAWYVLGFVGVAGPGERRSERAWVGLFGLRARDVGRELAVGVSAGALAWFGVIAAALAFGLLVAATFGEKAVAQEPAELIVWMAGLPVALRLGISLSAGVAEELFFRGFLQPRLGVAGSTFCFVCAHLVYGQPLMLFGITLLSLFYAWLVVWRGSIWAAMVAHFLFDAVQLLVIIPGVLEVIDRGGA
ncbi:MAG: CPBP family intramembrane metalloprotease [bacterium]|nr:CPBP family intramembrane metalloprotease [bacterium]